MELFTRRYLCLISFAFILTAFLMSEASFELKIVAGIVFSIAVLVCIALGIKIKKRRFEIFFSALLCSAVSLSAFCSYFFVSIPQSEAVSLCGEDTVLVRVISKSGEDEYYARLLRAGDREVEIKAKLIFKSEKTLTYGDRLIMNADIGLVSDQKDISTLIRIFPIDYDEIYVDEESEKNYFSFDGISALCYSLQDKFAEHTDKVFGDYGGYVKALLVNDTSDIDARTNNDFKRSGTSHILAVSGMHIALLMGALELLLRAIGLKKGIRIVIISIFAIFFLALTAFAASAVRSVIMLFAVYLCYLLYEENDSITALFASVAIIILFSPFSVYDLGMWMSFLATLGILTVYQVFDERMPYPKQKNFVVRSSLRALVWCAKAMALTVVANFFLLLIMWYFFGAVSLSSVPCNLILGPIVTVLMPLCAIGVLLGFIPYVSAPFVFLAKRLIDAMMYIVRYFSEARFGVLSLKYEFASVLIIAFTVALAVMLVIKLKHKLITLIPIVAFAAAFAICFSVFSYNSKPQMQCLKTDKTELVFLSKGAECSVIDTGEGDHRKSGYVARYMSKYATEIDEYFLINPSKQDVATIEYVCENTIIRTVYIPKSVGVEDLELYFDIIKCAEKYNIAIELLDESSNVEIYNGVSFSYTSDEGFLLNSDAVSVKKVSGELVAEYNGETRKITSEDSISIPIPLN